MVSRLLSSALGRLAVGTGQHDGIAVVVSKPDLAVSRAAGPLGWVAVGREDDLGLELARALDGGVEVVAGSPMAPWSCSTFQLCNCMTRVPSASTRRSYSGPP